MYAVFTCEQCFEEYDDDNEFVPCSGDACNETVCKSCAKKCKDPDCKRWVCESCLEGSSSKYCGTYCIKCAMWHDDLKDPEEWVNFDYIDLGMKHDKASAFLKTATPKDLQKLYAKKKKKL